MTDTSPHHQANAPRAMVALAFAPDSIRAHLLISILDSRGIEAHLVGEHAAALGAWAGNAHVSINVRLEDHVRALSELKSFLDDRAENTEGAPAATAPRPLDRCAICGYDLRGQSTPKSAARCPECGIDQDALTRVRAWVQLAPPPSSSEGHAFQATGAIIGRIIVYLFAAAVIALIIWLGIQAWT